MYGGTIPLVALVASIRVLCSVQAATGSQWREHFDWFNLDNWCKDDRQIFRLVVGLLQSNAKAIHVQQSGSEPQPDDYKA